MIDVNYIFQVELNKDRPREKWRDADRYSAKLQEAHQILWSKPLPNGELFTLEKISGKRLRHRSKLGEFILSSDRAVPSFYNKVSLQKMLPYLLEIDKDEAQSFWELSETIGGMAIWPAVKNNGNTINQNKCFGRNRTIIADRLDLTIECIRRYYSGIDSPLFSTFSRYADFFGLFETFKGYIDFFVFQDWVSDDYTSVKIAPPFDEFKSLPVPSTKDEYMKYRQCIMDLIRKRNQRIDRLYNTPSSSF
ncbi:MAG: hypothetical protein LBS21_02815 [Clostridiales bacterium]|jgi:hypothetical protein|nr:hypothetical protein [Clostridiales bacterium]